MSVFDEVKHILGDKTVVAVGAFILVIIAFIFNAGYQIGYEKAFVPKVVACEDEILMISDLEANLATCEEQKASEVLKCKTDCVSKVCRPLCIKDVKEAVENYKKLRRCK